MAASGSPLAVVAGESGIGLRENYTLQLNESYNRQAQSLRRREKQLAQCQKNISEFIKLDRFQSPTSKSAYGVDIRGRVWLLLQGLDGGCTLAKYGRLERPDYSIQPDGTRLWRTFYFENKQLCLYSRLGQLGKIKKLCYDPVDGRLLFAPYFLH